MTDEKEPLCQCGAKAVADLYPPDHHYSNPVCKECGEEWVSFTLHVGETKHVVRGTLYPLT